MTGTLSDIDGVLVGHAHDERALTGVTVVLTPAGAVCGVDVRGSAAGTRETDLLAPTALVERVHAIVLAGGSAYGLDAAAGVMAFCEERGIGYRSRAGWLVPIVPAAIIFDLAIGDGTVRPDRAMGYAAALAASADQVREGNVGAGCGATIGKLAGIARAMKGGVGSSTIARGDVRVSALAVVNAIGEVRDPHDGRRLAAARADDGSFLDPLDLLEERSDAAFDANTTLAVVATNVRLTKAEVTKVAQMAHDGFARTIYPIHTMHDGDVAFALSLGAVHASVDLVGTLAADAVAEAILRGTRAARAAGGLPACTDVTAAP